MLVAKCFILVVFCASYVWPQTIENADNKNRCTSLSCVHASASIIDLIETEIDPCNDFYGYACGNFVEEVFTPDEKSTLDTLTLMGDKLTEYLLTLYTKPILDTEPNIHKLSKRMFQSCERFDVVNKRGKKPLVDILEKLNGLPMLDGPDWNETKWDWKLSLLNLRKFISNKDDNIFIKSIKKDIASKEEKSFTEDELSKIEPNLKQLMIDVVVQLGASPNATHLSTDIEKLIEFEKELAEFYRKKVHFKNPKATNKKLKTLHKRVLWMEMFSKSFFTNDLKFNETLDANFIQIYYEFINNTPKRILANYVGWRVVQSSLSFMHKGIRDAELRFQKNALGKEDFEQRWKLCAALTQVEAPVSTGSLFVKGYFTKDDKTAAVELVDRLLDEYSTTIENSDWMDNQTKTAANNTAMTMKKYIGYHDKLETKEADEYYNDLFEYPEEKFLEMGLAFKVFEADRQYKRFYEISLKDTEDWTKYSKPATINAFYNSKDNSIQFPAGILQSPNFDKERPDVMNFGAIGSIIGHEITHAFDDLAEKKQNWSESNTKDYKNKVQCIVDQYNKYRINREDQYVTIDFATDGVATLKENIADCGGVKLAYNAYTKWSRNTTQTKAIGLDHFSNEQLFWLSFAQTFCSVERSAVLNNKDLKSLYALNRFRVIGPISNMPEFARDFNCPANAPMNPEEKCALW